MTNHTTRQLSRSKQGQTAGDFSFETAELALFWATELVRKQRFAPIAAFYREAVSETPPQEVLPPAAGKRLMPLTGAERQALAQDIYAALATLEDEPQTVLRLHAWGDYADEQRLHTAQKFQEAMRRRGVRVRLSYRYSLRQIGAVFGKDHKWAQRRLTQALAALEDALAQRGVVCPAAEAPKREDITLKNDVKVLVKLNK